MEEELENPIHMLIEARFGSLPIPESSRERSMGFSDYGNSLFVEEFGQPIAWRVDSHFAFLLRTTREQLLKFIAASFIAENFAINNDLQLIRVQCESHFKFDLNNR